MKPHFFLACNMTDALILSRFHDNLLVATPNITQKKHFQNIHRWVEQGKKLIIDSGVFEVCMKHARAHNLTLSGALSLPPEKLDGFPRLLDHFMGVARQLPDVFALVEMDVGGKESKRRMRAYLEAEGLKVAPVFHPILDGWEYLDELGERYPIIFVGNVVDASPELRLRINGRLQKWMQSHPDTWIHLLGLTPSPTIVAMPTHSCDSSAWLAATKFPDAWHGTAMWAKCGGFGQEMCVPRKRKHKNMNPLATGNKVKAVVALDEACQALSAAHYFDQLEKDVPQCETTKAKRSRKR